MSLMNVTVKAGPVEVPAAILSATEDKVVSLRQIAPNGEPIKRIDVDSDGNPVEFKDISSGYEYTKDKFIVLNKEELGALAPGKTTEIVITEIVPLSDIDPILFKNSYYLGLDQNADYDYAASCYADLMSVIDNKVAIATMVMRNKGYLVAIYAGSSTHLVVSTLHYADEFREPPCIVAPTSAPATAAVAKTIRDRLFGNFVHTNYSNAYNSRLKDLIANKMMAITGDVPVTNNEKEKVS